MFLITCIKYIVCANLFTCYVLRTTPTFAKTLFKGMTFCIIGDEKFSTRWQFLLKQMGATVVNNNSNSNSSSSSNSKMDISTTLFLVAPGSKLPALCKNRIVSLEVTIYFSFSLSFFLSIFLSSITIFNTIHLSITHLYLRVYTRIYLIFIQITPININNINPLNDINLGLNSGF